MSLTAFNSRLGISQGRISLEDTDEFVFVLGDDAVGYVYNLEVGDFAQIIQDIDLTGIDVIQAKVTVKIPNSTPTNRGFELSIVVDGNKVASFVCLSGQEREMSDLSANVSKSSGVFSAGVRLEVVEV